MRMMTDDEGRNQYRVRRPYTATVAVRRPVQLRQWAADGHGLRQTMTLDGRS